MVMGTITIKPVKTPADRKQFIKFPWALYRDDPNWVAPLLSDMKAVFNSQKNALLTLGPHQFFVAYKDGKVAGRIGVGIDEHLNEHKGYKSSYFTLFESIQDYEVAKALLDEVCTWAKENGAEFINGPQSPTNGDDYRGLLIKGFDSAPTLMNSYNPPYYQDFLEKYGFAKQFDRNAYYIDIANSEVPADFTKTVEYAKKRYGYRIAPIDMSRFKEQIEALVQVAVTSWPDDWPDMVPPSADEVRAEVTKLKPLVDPNLVYFAWDKDNKPVGVGVTFPDYNQVLKKLNGRIFPWGWLKFLLGKKKIDGTRSFILFTIPEYRKKGVSAAMYLEGINVARKQGYRYGDFSTIHDFNVQMNQDAVGAGGKLYKVFRIYKKDLV
jgi:GNAT superfamily N-acetyltransferase